MAQQEYIVTVDAAAAAAVAILSVVITLPFSFRLYHACAIYYRMHSAHNALHIIS